jgi:hypothetical protein
MFRDCFGHAINRRQRPDIPWRKADRPQARQEEEKGGGTTLIDEADLPQRRPAM